MSNEKKAVPVEERLKEESFSSNMHGTLALAEEAKEFKVEDYEIPESYKKDYLRLLPANVNTVYLYWEITDKLLSPFDGEFETFALKLYEKTQKGESEILGFYFKERVSSKYVNAYLASKNIVAAIGAIDRSGRFTELLRSNDVKMCTDKITQTNEEVWMSKQSEWMELIRASIPVSHFAHAKSSFSLLKEMELLKRYGENSFTGFSSLDLTKKG